jgi:hypothetical protein
MGNILCPHCNTATSLNPVLIEDNRAFMPDRSSETERVYEKAVVFGIKEAKYPYNVSYGIFECQACGERFLARKEEYTDWVVAYPLSRKPVDEEIPEPIKSQFEEAQLCFVVDAYLGCLLVCRTALIALQRNKGVTSLKELKEKGIISNILYEQADEVRLWANMVGHEDIPIRTARDDCEELLVYMEALLNAIYVEPKRLADLSQKRKQLKDD